MTKKRSQVRPPTRKADLVFKVGLTVLFVVALALTFWPEPASRTSSASGAPASTVEPGDDAATSRQPPPAPAPGTPMLPHPVQQSGTNTTDVELAGRADMLLVEKVIETGDVAQLSQFGEQLLSRGDFTNAVRVFRRTVELDEENEINLFNLGLALARVGQTNEAIARFKTALEIYPDYADAHNSLGLQLMALGDLAKAGEHFREALEIQQGRCRRRHSRLICSTCSRQKRKPRWWSPRYSPVTTS
jgi:hypothetical protein